MRILIAALVVGGTVLIVGCGSAAAPPGAAALMAKLGCTSLGTDTDAIATNYTVAYNAERLSEGRASGSQRAVPG